LIYPGRLVFFSEVRHGYLAHPVNYEKVVLAGGTAFPGCAGLTCYFGTGWKACATDLKKELSRNRDNEYGGQCPLYVFS
jgi:hypothetical protein